MRQSIKQKVVIDCANRLQSSGFHEAIASVPLTADTEFAAFSPLHADQQRYVPRKTPR